MNYLDLLTAGLVAYGVWRGRRRGFSRELPSLVGWSLFFVSGAGLYGWTNRLLVTSSQLTRQGTNVVGLLILAVASFQLARHFRARLREWAAARFRLQEAWLGAVAGGVRWLLIATLAMVLLGGLPLGFMRGTVRHNSLWGRLTHQVIWPLLHPAER